MANKKQPPQLTFAGMPEAAGPEPEREAPPPKPKPRRTSYRRLWHDRAVRRTVIKYRRLGPWLKQTDLPALKAFAQLERLSAEAYEKIRRDGLVRADGTPHPLLERFNSLRRTQALYLQMLGLSPGARRELLAGRERESDVVEACAEYANGAAKETKPFFPS